MFEFQNYIDKKDFDKITEDEALFKDMKSSLNEAEIETISKVLIDELVKNERKIILGGSHSRYHKRIETCKKFMKILAG